ncbi:hypothetical protein Trco_007055 [Trichoderma cornu-damae]|uniref:Methyltransferase type 11 domain-containing protein n=1 Tax=Trichoderma cornu-damae TaxID=654480 RepID=A0A9P8TUH7_9HYPO|nr:hypothetical protein Trco_007055 [Trichoderma cornu-damae]
MASANDLETISSSLHEHFQKLDERLDMFEQNFVALSRGVLRALDEALIAHMGLKAGQIAKPITLLDSACATGVMTQEVQALLPVEILQASSFTCTDNSAPMVNLVEKRIVGEKWVNTEVKLLDAMDSGLPENSFTHVAAGLALHLVPDPDALVKDSIRVLKPGGMFGASTWAKATSNMLWFPDVISAMESLPFDAPCPNPMPMQLHNSGHWDDAAWVEKHLQELGLTNVTVKQTLGTYRLKDADEFLLCIGLMLPWVMSTFWSEEVRKAHPIEEVQGLLKRYFEDKYHGEGWSLNWLIITMTGTVEK